MRTTSDEDKPNVHFDRYGRMVSYIDPERILLLSNGTVTVDWKPDDWLGAHYEYFVVDREGFCEDEIEDGPAKRS